MDISVVTPSYRNSEWLKLCVASVADQGVASEHIIQDNLSDDGTAKWLFTDPRVKAFAEQDCGMYDAINRGLRKATGDILAHLNCDEQYLPDALQRVRDYFKAHPDVDVVFGNVVVANSVGEYVCSRKVQIPVAAHVAVAHLPTFTCATFFRRKLIDSGRFFFDTEWRAVGDAEWMIRLLRAKVRMRCLNQFTSVFFETGSNLGLTTAGRREAQRLYSLAPPLARLLKPMLVGHHRFRRLLQGCYFPPPIDYAVYTPSSSNKRISYRIKKPTSIWKARL
ncbi:MAG: glycosyltransferase [Limisphaerales bacterium]